MKDIEPEGSHYDILLINDDVSTLRLIEVYFKTKGITCKLIVDERKGLKELTDNPPKAVLLDDLMPHISGFDLCKQIKSNPKLNHIPVFLLVHEELIEYHLDCKADGYITMPFSFSDLDKIINLLNSMIVN